MMTRVTRRDNGGDMVEGHEYQGVWRMSAIVLLECYADGNQACGVL